MKGIGADGINGREVEFQTSPTTGIVQWRYVDEPDWIDLDHDHDASYDAIGAAAAAKSELLDSVDTAGNTLKKLYNLIIGGFTEITVADIAARNALNVLLGVHVFVTDDGDGKWALYKSTTSGVNATYVKLSDPDLLNAVMSASQIKTAYESNPDTNAFTNALLAKLNAIEANADVTDADNVGSAIHGVAADALADSDELPFYKAALKKITWSNLKATLKAYFDTVYQATGSYLTDAASDGKTYGRKDGAWSEIISDGGTATGEIWTSLTGAYASATTFTFAGTAKHAKLILDSLFTCTDSTGATRRYGYVSYASHAAGTITATVVCTSDLVSTDIDFKVAYNQKSRMYWHMISIPGTMDADTTESQGPDYQQIPWNYVVLPPDYFVRTAATGTGILTVQLYKNTTALYSSAPDLATYTAKLAQRLTTFTGSAGETLSLRIMASSGTLRATYFQSRIPVIPIDLFTAF
jgi:hypothetical protein